ncbi:chemotaxis protein CheA [Sphingosinicella sp. BN140058]|uniref:chemotaxis protein CheA n=1 Tax=Sphingosinicella sp. BN140058 TaxID=1892855 RepID=UPI001013770E|nr:chemotaxis protein CheA [Sphingosinicella sp. BN140058]QAY75898.1 chemotaxis protein CheA [Sphingosinicella sp. BN140058]
MDELFEQFLMEGRELIARATEDLLALEAGQEVRTRIDSAFRAVHTLKGSVAIFDLAPMAAMLHAAEDLLGAARAASLDDSAIRALLACLDCCDRWLDALEASGTLPPDAQEEAARLANQLAARVGRNAAPRSAASADDRPRWLVGLLADCDSQIAATGEHDLAALRYTPRPDCFFAGDDPLALVASIPGLIALRVEARDSWPALADFDPYLCNLEIEALCTGSADALRQLFRFLPDQVEIFDVAPRRAAAVPDLEAAVPAADGGERTLRVETGQIDRLLDLIGELVVAKNRFGHLAAELERGADPVTLAPAMRTVAAATDRLVADMHGTVMRVRLVAMTRLFRRISRMVREIGDRLHRDLELVVTGEETRVDKALADALFEPLLHLVRNAIDHGIETAEARAEAGKAPRARLGLVARNAGDQIVIEVTDDGAGIDPERLRRVAAERALVSLAEADALDDAAALQLIFAPGFSTAADVTDISGRGVGMDAVRAAIESLGGRVSVASKMGTGTTVTLRLPATAALTTILVVRCGGEGFAVPIDGVAETIRIQRDAVRPVGVGRAFVLRNRTLPLLSLAELLGLPAEESGSDLKVLVANTGQGQVGLAVDDFGDRIDVILRPMTGLLANLPFVSGTTLLGDGSVILVLDLAEVIG